MHASGSTRCQCDSIVATHERLLELCFSGVGALQRHFYFFLDVNFLMFFLLFFRYSCLSPQQIKRMPIPKLAAADCLVVTWVTNRQKHLCFVKEELYPSWSVEVIAEWYWVKVSSEISSFVNTASHTADGKTLTVLTASASLVSSSGSDESFLCFVPGRIFLFSRCLFLYPVSLK